MRRKRRQRSTTAGNRRGKRRKEEVGKLGEEGEKRECAFNDESVLALVGQLNANSPIRDLPPIELYSTCEVLLVLADAEPDAFGEALLIFEYSHKEKVDIVVLEIPSQNVFIHLVRNPPDENLQFVLVLYRVLLLLAQQTVLLAVGVLQGRQQSALLQLYPLKFRSVFPQFFSHHLSQIFQLLRNVEHHAFLVLELLHAFYRFVQIFGELFPEEVPNIFEGVELNIHIEPKSDIAWHSQMK